MRLDRDGAVDRSLDTQHLGLYRPRGLAIAPDGTVLIADTGGSRIVRLSSEGALLDTIGPDVGGPERIRQPTDVAVGPEGEIFVVNGEEGALLRLSRRPVRAALVSAAGGHRARLPSGDRAGPERLGQRARRPAGEPLHVRRDTLRRGRSDPAGRLLRVPVGIAIGPDGTLYVADASLRAIVALYFER